MHQHVTVARHSESWAKGTQLVVMQVCSAGQRWCKQGDVAAAAHLIGGACLAVHAGPGVAARIGILVSRSARDLAVERQLRNCLEAIGHLVPIHPVKAGAVARQELSVCTRR